MKKHILFFVFFAFLSANLFAQQEVTLDEIKTASAHYLSAYNPERTLTSFSGINLEHGIENESLRYTVLHLSAGISYRFGGKEKHHKLSNDESK